MRRIAVGFDEETFIEIATSALQKSMTFGRRIRELVELGLETEKESEASCCTSSATAKSASNTRRRSSGQVTG